LGHLLEEEIVTALYACPVIIPKREANQGLIENEIFLPIIRESDSVTRNHLLKLAKEFAKYEMRKIQRTCFVSIPHKYLYMSRDIIEEVVTQSGFNPRLMEDEKIAEDIKNWIHGLIEYSSLVVADLTEINGNVTYEVGYALARKKPVITLLNTAITPVDQLPSLLKGQKHILYTCAPSSYQKLKKDLDQTIRSEMNRRNKKKRDKIRVRTL